jgi:hypothetical protein
MATASEVGRCSECIPRSRNNFGELSCRDAVAYLLVKSCNYGSKGISLR